MRLYYVFHYVPRAIPEGEYVCAYVIAINSAAAREMIAKFTNNEAWNAKNKVGVSEVDLRTPKLVTTLRRGTNDR